MSIRFILTKNEENNHELLMWNNEHPVTHKNMYRWQQDTLGTLVNAGFIGQDEKHPLAPYGESISLGTKVEDLCYGLVVELFEKGQANTCYVPAGEYGVPAIHISVDGMCPFIERSKITKEQIDSAIGDLYNLPLSRI